MTFPSKWETMPTPTASLFEGGVSTGLILSFTSQANAYSAYALKNALYLVLAAQWGVATPHAPSGKFKGAAADAGTGAGNAVPAHAEQTAIQTLAIATAHVQA